MCVSAVVSSSVSPCKSVWKLAEMVLLLFQFLVLIFSPYFLLARVRRKPQHSCVWFCGVQLVDLFCPVSHAPHSAPFSDRVGRAGVLVLDVFEWIRFCEVVFSQLDDEQLKCINKNSRRIRSYCLDSWCWFVCCLFVCLNQPHFNLIKANLYKTLSRRVITALMGHGLDLCVLIGSINHV